MGEQVGNMWDSSQRQLHSGGSSQPGRRPARRTLCLKAADCDGQQQYTPAVGHPAWLAEMGMHGQRTGQCQQRKRWPKHADETAQLHVRNCAIRIKPMIQRAGGGFH